MYNDIEQTSQCTCAGERSGICYDLANTLIKKQPELMSSSEMHNEPNT